MTHIVKDHSREAMTQLAYLSPRWLDVVNGDTSAMETMHMFSHLKPEKGLQFMHSRRHN